MLRDRHKKTPASAVHAKPQTGSVSSLASSSLLIHWDDLPAWRRDNAFIHTGYRATSNSFYASFCSLAYLHNESVNIWSHLLGSVGFVLTALYLYAVIAPRYESASPADIAVFAAFLGGAVLCLGMSATYHALSNHSSSVAKWGNKLDYTGIVFLIVGSYVPALYYGFYCDIILRELYTTLICMLGFGCVLVSWIERFRTPEWRPYRALMFVALGTSGVVPILQGLEKYGWTHLQQRMSLSLVILHGAMYVIGAVIYAARWPERLWPGAFDHFGSSHQIFHVFVLVAALTHMYAMALAFDYHHTVVGRVC
ncbi:ADIPOR-like receptor SPBC12C2.09c [Ceratocystis fimbriata CBS 114723]|uniref:ADIPOR-like receptor SPBC12C2.09c n=1 Tax=Ceratocystis fimbriata CBS 114723 TaxID=1035309 RepID=A0A2C5WIU7_9PEZI|nr:ADIPOR-like receptor SPBC12C2.09c [Ceratocystis fimbriata CBS 114723]